MSNLNLYNVKENEKAWLAGFIDGEGYIGITFQRKKRKSPTISIRTLPSLLNYYK